MGSELRPCPFCGLNDALTDIDGAGLVKCRRCWVADPDTGEVGARPWGFRFADDAATARAEAAERLSNRYAVFVQECGFLADIEVYSPDDLPSISERLGAFRARAEAAEQRAEAAEADLADLRGEMASECADAAETERAAIVAWLRDQDDDPDSWLWAYADRIRGGEHLEAPPAGEVSDV